MLLETFKLIAILVTLVLSGQTIFFTVQFTIELLKNARKDNLDSTLCFLLANFSVFVLIGLVIKLMVKGLV